MTRKVCIVVGSRANYGRIKATMSAIKEHKNLQLQVVVGASALLYRFGNVIETIRQDGFEVSGSAYQIIEGENPTTMAKSTGLAVMELAGLFEHLQPDVVLTVADRFETMGTAVAASYMNIHLAHTQGGEITGSIDESVRHSITKLAHVHFPATEKSRDILIRMGERPETVHLVGCPSIDLIANQDLALSGVFQKYGGVGQQIDASRPYLVVLQHPVTTEYGSGLAQVRETLEAVRKTGIQVVWFWPNVDAGSDDVSKGLRTFREDNPQEKIHFYRNMEPLDYARLINNCAVLIGNSSSAIREGSYLGIPAVNIGIRQQGRERSENVIDVDFNSERIFDAIKVQLDKGRYTPSTLYGDGNASTRIADVLSRDLPPIQKRFHI